MNARKTFFHVAVASFVFAPGFIGSAQAQAPVITATPSSNINYTYTSGGAVPNGQPIVLSSNGITVNLTGATVTYTGAFSNWLTLFPPVQPPGLSTPATITPYLNQSVIGTLPAGIYAAQILLTYSAAVDPSSATSIAVFLNVTGGAGGGGGGSPNETITASPTSIGFSYAVGGSAPASVALAIATSDNANYSASVLTNDGNPWLAVSPTTGTTPGTITVSANPLSLAAGNYNGTITVQAPNSVVQIPVTFNIGGVSLSVNPSSLTFSIPQNYGYGAPQSIVVTASAAANFQAFAGSFAADGVTPASWLVVDTPSGKTPGAVVVRANDSGLLQGVTYTGQVTVQTSPSNATLVPVTLTVGPPATLQLSASAVAFSYTIGGATPATQTVSVKSLTSAAQTFTATTTTTDGAAWLLASATAPTPGLVSLGINPGTLLPGSYTGIVTITPSTAGASPQPIAINLTVLPAPTPVVLSTLSSASYAGGTVAPGEFVTLFGSALGPATLTTPTPGTAPKTLGGTVVTFDGIPAPILYASATQTSVQVPYGINLPTTVLQVQRAGATSVTTNLISVPAYPGLFTSNAKGTGQAAALNQDFTLNSPSNPAPRGSTIILYGTGEGKTNPASVEGNITLGIAPLPQPLFPVSVSFSGVPATSIPYAGETPTALAGLMQINAVIPLNAPVGPAVAVSVAINGQTSPGNVTIAIQ